MTELTPPVAMPVLDALELLERGEITVQGRITTASNATLYCCVELDGVAAACVYKPVAGERPLWDFPDGTLAEREVATYLVAAATGWEPVPPTVLREGPMGTGMAQLWIAHDDSFDIIGAINSGRSRALQRMALLDAVVNNSDRKVSHLLPVIGPAGGARAARLRRRPRGELRHRQQAAHGAVAVGGRPDPGRGRSRCLRRLTRLLDEGPGRAAVAAAH